MKTLTLALLAFFCITGISAQEDLLKLLDEEEKQDAPTTEYVANTFKAVRIVNSHSVELPAERNLQFVIQHRFGRVDEGWRNFFGIDNADMRIGLEYGIFPWWSAGFGRSSVGGTFDFYTRFKMLRQSKGAKNIPLSLAWYSNIGISSKGELPEGVETAHRLSYAHQLLIARKFTRNFSFQVMPTYVHLNLVDSAHFKNDIVAIGFGARYLITRSVSLNLEYFQPVTKKAAALNKDEGELYIGSISFGIDIETGGHVFQITVTNSTGMIEQLYIPGNTAYWWDKEIRLGFNINRNITFGTGKWKKKDKAD
ncbi:MAG TPA: DUF5777 family beta-barrel protein [Chitinophagales bacterium]|nr:DUF5777 family beta-barrel protein [Chitinophagales bacterium]